VTFLVASDLPPPSIHSYTASIATQVIATSLQAYLTHPKKKPTTPTMRSRSSSASSASSLSADNVQIFVKIGGGKSKTAHKHYDTP
jgi:hypothetical protein